jgi:hypothetical protein
MDNDLIINQLTCVITILGPNYILIRYLSRLHLDVYPWFIKKTHPTCFHPIHHPKLSTILTYFSFNFIHVSSIVSSTFYLNFSSMLHLFFHPYFICYFHPRFMLGLVMARSKKGWSKVCCNFSWHHRLVWANLGL